MLRCSTSVVFFFFFSFSGWGETESTWYVGHCWPVVPAPDDRWWWWLWSSRWNEDWQGKPKYSEKTCSNATLSTTNPTWLDLWSNPGRRGGKAATNRLSYGTAFYLSKYTYQIFLQCQELSCPRIWKWKMLFAVKSETVLEVSAFQSFFHI
jgi:hypothetical protein